MREEAGGPDAVASTADTLERVTAIASDEPTREILERARESVLTSPPRDWESPERQLFRHAEPVPLVLGPLTPVDRQPRPARAPDNAASAPRVLALVDADLADAVREVLRDVRERWRSSRAVRLGMTGAVGALVVVAAVLLWPQSKDAKASDPGVLPAGVSRITTPTGEPATASAPTAAYSTSAEREAEAAPTPSRTSGPLPSEDPVEAARALFAAVDRCAGDAACVTSFTEVSAGLREPLPPGSVDADIELIDDFGGVFVVRLTVESTVHYVTVVRQEDRWLVRAVGTSADQPS